MAASHLPLRSLFAVSAAALLAGSAQAQLDYYSEIDSSQEVPSNGSTATGTADITIDTTTNALTYTITFSGLGSAETGAHIHGLAAPGSNAGVLHVLPSGSPKTGTWFYPEAMEAGILGGMTYINIHSSNFGGGEIRGQICPRPEVYCACDAASGPPCGNADPNAGCMNSTGQGAKIGFSGLPSVILDSLELSTTSAPTGQFGIFFSANNQGQIPFGDGQLCALGAIRRFGLSNSGGSGTFTLDAGFVSASGIAAGQTKTFQTWFRDPMGPCGSGFNTSDALSVQFTP